MELGQLIRRSYAGRVVAGQLRELIKACNEYDGTAYGCEDPADIYYLRYGAAGADDMAEADDIAGIGDIGRTLAESACNTDSEAEAYMVEAGRSRRDERTGRTGRDGSRSRRLLGALCIYRMGDTRNGRPVDEVCAFTLPGVRRRGIFTALYKTAIKDLRPVVRFPVYVNDDAMMTLSALKAEKGNDELLMFLETERLNTDLQAGTAERTEMGFGLEFSEETKEGRAYTEHSEFSFNIYCSDAYIYNVRTDASFQRRGSAYRLLKAALPELSRYGAARAFLQVSSDNAAAVGLYTKLGFTTGETLSYYYIEHIQ